MTLLHRLSREEEGASTIEMAFALPTMIVMIWCVLQLGIMFQAMSGIQHALGEGARYATIFPTPSTTAIKDKMSAQVFGTSPGTFNIPTPTTGTGYVDLQVTYTQPTNLLFVPGPTISVTRSKRVWVAG